MMKTMLVTLRENDDEPETYVLQGDRRQSNDRMLLRGLEKLFDESVEFVDEEKRHYRTRETDRKITIEETRLPDNNEAKDLKRQHFTLVINENVTEGACKVRYS